MSAKNVVKKAMSECESAQVEMGNINETRLKQHAAFTKRMDRYINNDLIKTMKDCTRWLQDPSIPTAATSVTVPSTNLTSRMPLQEMISKTEDFNRILDDAYSHMAENCTGCLGEIQHQLQQ